MNIIFGYKPEISEDFTELEVASNKTRSSGEYIIPEAIKIENQLTTSSCVANAISSAIETLMYLKDPSKVKQVSRLFIYYNARKYHNSTNKDDGTYISKAMDSLIKYGICLEDTWEFDIKKINKQPNIKAYKQAKDNEFKVNAFYQIKNNNKKLDSIEASIRSNHAVIFGTKVDEDFIKYNGEDKVFEFPKNPLGGHAMLIVGVSGSGDSRKFLIKNSWSSKWGKKGHAWLSSDYIMKSRDFFVITFDKDLVV